MDNPTPLMEVPDAELLAEMAQGRGVSEAALHASHVFRTRHEEYLYWVLTRSHQRLIGSVGVELLVERTLDRVRTRAAGTYREPEDDEPNLMRRAVRAWMGRIAENLYVESVRAAEGVLTRHLRTGHWQNVPDAVEETPASSSPELVLLEDGLRRLRPIEQEVLREWFRWHDPDQPDRRPPQGVMKRLAQRLGRKPDTLRKIRARALDKLREHLGRALRSCKTGGGRDE